MLQRPNPEYKESLTQLFDDICRKEANQWDILGNKQHAESDRHEPEDPNTSKSVVSDSTASPTRLNRFAAAVAGVLKGNKGVSPIGGIKGGGPFRPVLPPFPI